MEGLPKTLVCATFALPLLLGAVVRAVQAARRARGAAAIPAADDADNSKQRQPAVVLPPPEDPAAGGVTHVFVSHPGEVKYQLVSHIREKFQDKYPALSVFVDEWSLQPGDRAMERMAKECWQASVGVLILTKEFVRKKHCMAELQVLLQRWEQGNTSAPDDRLLPQHQSAAGDAERQVQLLPVLYRLTVDELKSMRQLYDTEPWCVEEAKPDSNILDKWAADLQQVPKFTLVRQDQWHGDAQLVTLIVDRAVEQLKAAKQLPQSLKPTLDVRNYAPSPSSIPLVGREEELEQGRQALREQRYVEVRGPPGEGKSTLVQHLAAAVCDEWEQLPQEEAGGQVAYVLEVDMRGLAQWAGGVEAAVALHLLSTVPGAVTKEQQAATGSLWNSLLGWLRQQARVLIIFENTEALLLDESLREALQPMIKTLLAVQRAGAHHVHVVVATRVEAPPIEGTHSEAATVQLRRLSEHDAVQLLKAHLVSGSGRAWSEDEEQAAKQLVQLAECNPLALSVAAGLVKAKDLKWQDLVSKQRLQDLQPASRVKAGGMGHQIHLLRKWIGSFLTEAEQHGLAVLTVFPGSFTLDGAAAVADCEDASPLLATLAGASLVWQRAVTGISSREESLEEQRYSMHALVREAAQALPAADATRSGKHVQSLVRWMLVDDKGPGQLLLSCAPAGLAPDTLRFWYILREEDMNMMAAAAGLAGLEVRDKFAVVVDGALQVGLELSNSGLGNAARALHEAAVAVTEQALGAEHPDTLESMSNLAVTLWNMGELAQARRLQERVSEVCTRVLGAEHPDTLTSMNNLACILWNMGELAQARRLQEQVLEVSTRVLGAEHPKTLTSMSNLAGTLRNMGELAQARQLQKKVLEVSTRVLGAEHPQTMKSMGNLATILRNMGELAQARWQEQQLLEFSTRVLGAEHPDTLTSMNNLATTLWKMGELAQARRLVEQAWEVSSRVLGVEHPNTLNSMTNLAIILKDMGQLAQASQLQEQVLQVSTTVLGAEHPDTLKSMNNLALTLWKMGELAQARQVQEQVLEVFSRVLGAEHPDTVTSMSNLAATLWKMGELAQAMQLQAQVLDVRTRVLGAEHPDTLTSMSNLGTILQEVGRLA